VERVHNFKDRPRYDARTAKRFLLGAIAAMVMLNLIRAGGALAAWGLVALIAAFVVVAVIGNRVRKTLSDHAEYEMQCANCGCLLIADYALGAEFPLESLMAAAGRILTTGACPNCGKQFAA
jgi:hypothetical protein